MSHYLYIIYSKKLQQFYVGESADPKHRLDQHNTHYFKTNFTRQANDWKTMLSYKCNAKEDAIFLEKFIKRMKSKVFTQKIIENPKILDDILNQK